MEPTAGLDREAGGPSAGALIDAALARAVVYRTFSTLFQSPTDAGLRQIGARDGFPVVAAAWRYLAPPGGEAGVDLQGVELGPIPVPDLETLESAYVRLFGHTARGPVPSCETEYGMDNAFHQPQQLADISGYYVAFGLGVSTASATRVDHIACELEFMDFLNRKEALLLATPAPAGTGDETIEATRQAMRTFLRDHLGRFGLSFASRLAAEDPDGFFGALGRWLLAFLERECARLGIEAGPADLVLRPETPDDLPVGCGTADELIQIQRRP